MNIQRFFDTVYEDNAARSLAERRQRLPDIARYVRNAALGPVDAMLTRRYRTNDQAIFFIVGAPRSGTTLLYQLIAKHLDAAYISNQLARFWSAPLAGAALLQARYGATHPSGDLTSHYGRAPDAFGPHEFSWFWHYWGDFSRYDDLRGDELDRVDWSAIADRLSALAGHARRPLVLKSINFTNYQTQILARHLPNARFLWIDREPLYCAQSILEARMSRYGDIKRWWSIRPRDAERFREREPSEQVAHQIADIAQALTRSASTLGHDRFHRVRYEDLTTDPTKTLSRIAEFMSVDAPDAGTLSKLTLKPRNQTTLDPNLLRSLEAALEREPELGFDAGVSR